MDVRIFSWELIFICIKDPLDFHCCLKRYGNKCDFDNYLFSILAYRFYTVVPRLVKYIDMLTNWYVKLNKKRFKVTRFFSSCHIAFIAMQMIWSLMNNSSLLFLKVKLLNIHLVYFIWLKMIQVIYYFRVKQCWKIVLFH